MAIGAFVNTDGSVVGVLTNSGGSAQRAAISFRGLTPLAASAWLTDRSHSVNTTSSILSGGAATVTLPPHISCIRKESSTVCFVTMLDYDGDDRRIRCPVEYFQICVGNVVALGGAVKGVCRLVKQVNLCKST